MHGEEMVLTTPAHGVRVSTRNAQATCRSPDMIQGNSATLTS